MKKLALTTLTVLSCGMAYALPVFNPTEASLYTNGTWWSTSCCDPCDPCFSWCDAFSLRVGFYGDYVFQRNLERSNGHIVDSTTIFTNGGTLTLNICDWIDVWGMVGASKIKLHGDAALFATANPFSFIDLDFRSTVSWAVGARATIWECNNFGIGVEGQYFQTTPELGFIGDESGFVRNDAGGKTAGSTYGEWQAGLGASYTYSTGCPGTEFVPYIAVKWAGATFSLDNNTYVTHAANTYQLQNLTASKLWGYAVGVTATINHAFGVSVEGRWGDESAVSVDSQLRF